MPDLGEPIRTKGPDAGVLIILIIAALLTGAYLTLCFVYGFEASDLLKMWISALVCVASVTGVVGQLRSLLVLAENGISRRGLRGTISIAFDEVTTITVD